MGGVGGTRMRCTRCEHQNRDGARFCEECAAPLASRCPSCGEGISAASKFCRACGRPVAPGSHPESLASESRAPKPVAADILTSKRALEGERKHVTVLFADLKSSMELLADQDPEEARRILDPVLEFMMEAVHRYGGTVNQVMGDGIMALFGAPTAQEDHAVRACYAALRMQESVKRYAEQLVARGGKPIQIRTGLNSGEVVVRAIGSDLHTDYTAVGQAAHLAARMEQIAQPGMVVLTSSTLSMAEDFIRVRSLGPTSVKGLSELVEIYELLEVEVMPSRFRAHMAARGLTKFVGRTSEMSLLQQALDVARSGRGQIVAVAGEPGVGKSRLFWEFVHSHRTHGCSVVESASVSYGKSTMYLPVVELIHNYFEIERHDDAGRIRSKLVDKLVARGHELQPGLTALLTLLDVPVDDARWMGLDPAQRRQQILETLKRLLIRESLIQPLLVVFDDLHWIDEETQAMLDALVESLPTTRLLLLVNYRPEYRHTWAGKTYYQQLSIGALPAASAEELLEAILGDDESLDPVKRLLIERTEGNPFFLGESVRTLVETGVLTGELGRYRVARMPDSLQIPPTVRAIVAARIDRLSPAARTLLQSAAAIGKDVSLEILRAVVDETDETLITGLAELQTGEFVYQTGVFVAPQFAFHHALTHEVAYGTLLQTQRQTLHARIVVAIEGLYKERLQEHVEQLADHAMRGQLWERALVWLRAASAKAFARSAHRTAVDYLAQALVALTRLPQSEDRIRLGIDIRFDLRNSLFAIGDHGRAGEFLREAEELARQIGDPRREAWAACYFMVNALLSGNSARTLQYGRRALTLGVRLSEPALTVVANLGMGQAQHALGQYREAITSLSVSLEVLNPVTRLQRFGMNSPPAIACMTWLAWCHAERGEFSEGRARAEEGLQIAEEVNDAWGRASGHLGLGLVHLRQGRFQTSVDWLGRGLKISETFGLRTWLTPIGSALGYAHLLDGDTPTALELLQRAVAEAETQGVMFRHSLRLAWLAEARWREGARAAAEELANRALDLARDYEEHGHEAYALWLLGELSVDEGSARTRYEDALRLASTLEMRPLEAQCHLSIGERFAAWDQREAARRELLTARSLFVQLGIDASTHRADAALAVIG
jgi:class 3 adenylate cyclase/tetratricopeptide (TPR) repeat protein